MPLRLPVLVRPLRSETAAMDPALDFGRPPSEHRHRVVGQALRYAVVGTTSTAFQLGLYLLLRGVLGPLTANLIALVISNVANTAANRHFTFGVRGRGGAARQQLQSLLLFLLSLGLTTSALWLLNALVPHAPQSAELGVLIAATVLGTVARFSLMRLWVFAR